MDLALDVRKSCPNLEKTPCPVLEDIPLKKSVDEVPAGKEIPPPPSEKKNSENNPKILKKQISSSNLSLKEKIVIFTNSVLPPNKKHKRSQSSPILWVDETKVFSLTSNKLEETEVDTHDFSNPKFGMKPEEVFEMVLENPKLLKNYRNYLREIFADENLNFYLRVNEFEKIKDPVLRKNTAEEIYKEFILRDAPQAINITGQEFAVTELRVTKMEISENMFLESKGHIFQILKVAVMDFWIAYLSK